MDIPVEPISNEQRTWAMVGHLSALSGHIIPFGHIIGPLIVWIVKKDTMPFVSDQAKEALNFQITATIAGAVAVVLCFVLIGVPLLIAIWVLDIIFTIIAAVKANEGVAYRYPVTLRLIN